MFVVAFLKEKTASLNSFVVRDVSVKGSDVKGTKCGIVGKSVQVCKFVKKISCVFNVGWYSTNYRFEVIVNQL